MDWLALGLGVAGIAGLPLAYIAVFVFRRRHRALSKHDTTPPTPSVTTGQRR